MMTYQNRQRLILLCSSHRSGRIDSFSTKLEHHRQIFTVTFTTSSLSKEERSGLQEATFTTTSLGGLGVADFKLTGYALQTSWLWLQKTDQDGDWSALPIQVDPIVQAFFHASISVTLGERQRTLFWTDNWVDGGSISTVP